MTAPVPPSASVPQVRVVPYWFAPVAIFVGGVVVTVLLGGALAGLVSGAGLVVPAGVYGIAAVVKGIVLNPGDPGSAWPDDARPGGPIVTWICLGVVAFAYAVAVGIVTAKVTKAKMRRRNREKGLADHDELAKRGLDRKSAVRKAKTNRASLAEVADSKLDAATVATRLGTLYGGRGRDGEVFLQYRDGVMVEGPTGSGKTWRLAWQRVVESPGFVVATTTKPDLLWSTVGSRLAVGPVEVFDPERITMWPFPMRWSLLAGCEDPDTALRRAAALVKAMPMGDGSTNAAYFESKAAVLMRCYLYAAAKLGKDLRTVRRWASSRSVNEVQVLLDAELPDWGAEFSQLLGSGSDSADDVVSTASRLLEPLASPRLMDAVDISPAESVDLEALVRAGGTVYLISKGKSLSCAPFVAVMANELHHIAEQISLSMPQERLDPPMRMVLDEVNNVAPIPELPSLITDSGGRGISIWCFSHGEMQNRLRWGQIEGQMFTTTSPVRIVLPGLGDQSELESLSRLLGTYDEWMAPGHGPRTKPVMSGDEIRKMPADQALVIYRDASPALVHLPTVWDVPHLAERVKDSKAVYEWICEHAELPEWAGEGSEVAS